MRFTGIQPIFFVLLISIITYLISFESRTYFDDDAWLGEHVYSLHKTGYIKSELFAPLLDYDDQLFVYHKLFTYATLPLVSLFGFGLIKIRFIVLICLIGITALIVGKRKLFRLHKNQSVLVVAFILVNPIILKYGTIYRPELMVTLMGLISYTQLNKYLIKGGGLRLTLASFFAGLATLAHLNGIIFIASGAILLFFKKRFYKGVIFGLLSMLIASFYFTDIIIYDAWDTFLNQFSNDPALFHKKKSVWANLSYLIDDHKRWFHNLWISIFSTFSLVILFFYIRFRRGNIRLNSLLIYTLLLGFFLALLSPLNTEKYTIYLIPFICILWIRVLPHIQQLWPIKMVLIAYFIVGIVQSILLTVQRHSSFSSIEHILTSETRIIAPMEVLFENQKSTSFLLGTHYFLYFHNKYNKIEGSLSLSTLTSEARKWNIDHIILRRNEYAKIRNLTVRSNHYKKTETDDFIIFSKTN